MKNFLLSIVNDKSKRNFFIYGIGQAFNLLSPLIVAPIIVSVCKLEGLGKTGLGFALALFLILIVDYAFDIKGTKQVSENRDDPKSLQTILNAAIFTKIILFSIALVIALVLICFLPFFQKEATLFFLSLVIVFAQVFNPVWFLQGIESFTFVSLLNIGSKVLYVILVFSFIVSKNDYVYVNLFLGSSSFLFNIIGLIVIKLKYDFKIIPPSFQEIEVILKNDFSFCLSQLFLSARQLSPLVFTGYFLGFSIAGQYKILEQIITLFRTLIQVFLKFFYPRVCYMYVIEMKKAFLFWKKYTLFNILFVFTFLSVIFIFSENILRFFHLTESTITHVNTIFRVSLIIPLLMAVSLPLEQLMFVCNKNRIYIRITIFVTVINIILILVLIQPFQLNGIIASLIVSELFFISFYFYNSYLNIKSKLTVVSN